MIYRPYIWSGDDQDLHVIDFRRIEGERAEAALALSREKDQAMAAARNYAAMSAVNGQDYTENQVTGLAGYIAERDRHNSSRQRSMLPIKTWP